MLLIVRDEIKPLLYMVREFVIISDRKISWKMITSKDWEPLQIMVYNLVNWKR